MDTAIIVLNSQLPKGKEKVELGKQLIERNELRQVYDEAEALFRQALISTIPVRNKALLLARYEILKAIAERLLLLELNILKEIFRSDIYCAPVCDILVDAEQYRVKWNELNILHHDKIVDCQKYLPQSSALNIDNNI